MRVLDRITGWCKRRILRMMSMEEQFLDELLRDQLYGFHIELIANVLETLSEEKSYDRQQYREANAAARAAAAMDDT